MPDASFNPSKVSQYCYFWIASRTVTADEIAAAVGIEPDRVEVRGSKTTEPQVRPVEHSWSIVCGDHGRIEDQATELLRRMEPAADAVRSLVDQGNVEAGLMMVRDFDDPEGSYNAMGWWLTREQVALLAAMGAGIQSDEYLGNAAPQSDDKP